MTIQVTWERGYDRLPRLQWDLEEAAWKAFEKFGIVHELTSGEALFEQGEASHALYLVVEGEVALLRDGKEIARVNQNISFGEMGLLLKKPRSATASALRDSRVLELSRSDIENMLEEEPLQAAHLYRVLAECLAEYLALAQED